MIHELSATMSRPADADRPMVMALPVGNAALTNMSLCFSTLMDCIDAPETSPRIGLFFSFSGFGKTTAAAYAASQADAIYIQALPIWTQRSFLIALATELGLARLERNAPGLLAQIIQHLRERPRAIIIDETDYLIKDRFIEIIRAIHDHTSVAILLIGEEALPAKLKAWERFDNRILVATAAQPASDEDVLKLRDNYCRKVAVADDLAFMMADRVKRVTRRIATNLQAAQKEAMTAEVESIDLAWWGNRPVRTGDIPTRRSMGFGK